MVEQQFLQESYRSMVNVDSNPSKLVNKFLNYHLMLNLMEKDTK